MIQGAVSATTMEKVKEFVNAGGTVVYIGDVTMAAAQAFNLPVTNHLEGLGQDKFYVPGSVLRMTVDPNDPVAHGMNKEMDVFFDNDPVFKLGADAAAKGVRPVGWFATDDPLRSGWAYSYRHLENGDRQILEVFLPGDIIGLREFAFSQRLENVRMISDGVICHFPHKRMLEVFRESLSLTSVMFAIASRQQALLTERLVNLARRSARKKMAHFLNEMYLRLRQTNDDISGQFC